MFIRLATNLFTLAAIQIYRISALYLSRATDHLSNFIFCNPVRLRQIASDTLMKDVLAYAWTRGS